MKITADVQSIMTMLEEAESFRPVVIGILELLKSYGPEASDMLETISKWSVQNRLNRIKQYEKGGLTRKEAILLTIDSAASLQKAILAATKSDSKSK